MKERLQKLISASGVASRRQAEALISQGRVTVNGEVATLGVKADLDVDLVCVDETPLHMEEQRYYFMLHKPSGYVSTLSDEKDRPTVADLMADCGIRVWPVGRLDYNSEGLLFMTNDGDLTHHILHPSHQIEKEYLVWVVGDVANALPSLSKPMELDGEYLAPAKVKRLHSSPHSTKLSITIHQGKNRQIRRMCAQVDLKVLRLQRIREGTVSLDPKLPQGKWRPLTQSEVDQLKYIPSNTDKRS